MESLKCRGCGTGIKATSFICKNCGRITEQALFKVKTRDRTPLQIAMIVLGTLALVGLLIVLPAAWNSYLAGNSEPKMEGHKADGPWAFPSNDRAAILAEVRRRITLGTPDSTMMATALLSEKFGLGPAHTDPDLRPLWNEAKAAYEKVNAVALAEKARDTADHWRNGIEGLSDKQPVSMEQISTRLTTFETAAQSQEDFPDRAREQAWTPLKRAIQAKQRSQFPMLRAAYAEFLRQQVWEQNIEVRASGGGSRTLILTGAIFASNAAIAEMQRASQQVFQKLRFSKITYEWYRGSRSYTYTLPPVSDEEVGYWEGALFHAIE